VADELAARRRLYAEELEAVCNLRTAPLVEALARVPRERFLRPGPWWIRGEGDVGRPSAHQTPDGDSRHVYHNVSIAIDLSRQLFNGAPGVVAMCIDALGLRPGERVLQVGCGLGYYSAVMADCVGPRGRVVAVEIDDVLAAEARVNLASLGWVEVRQGDGVGIAGESYDAILVNAGMTHPHEAWLDALTPGGRLVVPLTFTADEMGTIGKGVVALISNRGARDVYEARAVTMVAIYSAVGIRDAVLNERIREAFMRGPWPMFKRLRRDPHEPSPSCWLHGDTFCLASE